ncbi:hypothetical protein BDZ89DRAFT_1118362 [Hymenopellis radicata]|nr:hypothetical protein BDZ89DRAFT_1118362 [Hymenopellis radicata]
MEPKTNSSYARALKHTSQSVVTTRDTPRASSIAPTNPPSARASSSPTPPQPPLAHQTIAKVDASLIIPYYELCLFAHGHSKNPSPPEEDSTWKSVTHRRLPRPESLQSHLTRALTTIKTAVAQRENKGGRPGIVCSAPTDWTGSPTNSWIFPMGTFDGHNEETLPEVLREFALPVLQANSCGDSTEYIRTTPTWRTRKRLKSGELATQWVVSIPLMMTDDVHPTEPWGKDRQGNPYYKVSRDQYRDLIRRSDAKMNQFIQAASTKPGYLEDFVKRLEQNESELPPNCLRRHLLLQCQAL